MRHTCGDLPGRRRAATTATAIMPADVYEVFQTDWVMLALPVFLLALVLESDAVLVAFHGILRDNETLKNFSLEYLDLMLPREVRKKLWPFIGDVSERERKKTERSVDTVLDDLMATGASIVASEEDTAALRKALGLDEG